jgi:hypothetical protein
MAMPHVNNTFNDVYSVQHKMYTDIHNLSAVAVQFKTAASQLSTASVHYNTQGTAAAWQQLSHIKAKVV